MHRLHCGVCRGQVCLLRAAADVPPCAAQLTSWVLPAAELASKRDLSCWLLTVLCPAGFWHMYRDFPGFSAAFRQMELEPVVQQQQRAQPERRSAGRGRGRGRGVASSSGAASSGGRGRGRGRGRRRKRYALGTSSEEDEASSSSSGFSSDEDESEDWGARYAAGLEDDGSGGGSGSSSGEEGESGAEEAPAPLPQQQQQRRQRRGRRGGRGGTAEPARWRRPATHAALVLDQQALRQALAEGRWFAGGLGTVAGPAAVLCGVEHGTRACSRLQRVGR